MAANFSYTFYGLVFGTNWGDAYGKYLNKPDLIMQLAWAQLLQHPMVAVQTGWRAIWGYFAVGEMVNFIGQQTVPAVLFKWLIWVGTAFCALAAARQPMPRMLLLVLAGMLASMPFAPYWDVDYGRAYAATLPLLMLLPCAGISWVASTLARWQSGNDHAARALLSHSGVAARTGVWVAAMVVVAMVPAPVLLYWAAPAISAPPGQAMPDGEWRVDLRAHLRLSPPGSLAGGPLSSRSVPVSGFSDGSNWDGRSWRKEHDAMRLLPPSVILTSNNIDNSLFVLKDQWIGGPVPDSHTGKFTRIQRGEHGFFVDAAMTELVAQILALPDH